MGTANLTPACLVGGPGASEGCGQEVDENSTFIAFGVIISFSFLGICNKVPQTVWLKKQRLIYPSCGGWKSAGLVFPGASLLGLEMPVFSLCLPALCVCVLISFSCSFLY